MTTNECFSMMSAMGWLSWIMPLAVLALLGLGIAALIKYLFMPRSQSDRGVRS
ncbi:hypothetical protein [Halomonas elongata]|uniref:Uncharacterized protein n=1 Tax=Halomonas elongata (strain ATCC 33173 / DSM 2581 / NBRC 15536 / NCIMB 2198 / 1H9) TaxID=768066 RepID=A0ABZ0TA03_HALED|nr:hypothetical protein [Halomonas elongata]WBF18690.1 hypothetical protein LM502_03015 [Halomonas elongata]WPU47545.1 hypothetical protein SR933_01240 [Halomonas elongata DSM 2581]